MIDSMIDMAIEIEGLLRIVRDGKPSPETYSLLKRKTTALSEACAGLDKTNPHTDNYSSDTETDDIVFTLDEDEEYDDLQTEETPADTLPTADAHRESTTLSGTPQPKPKKNLRSRFSLNDRFLYTRELFDGNMKTFDATIALLEGTEDFSAIEEYFYNELDWDREDANVISFMEILRGL